MPPPPMNTRPMLACADGSFLPLIAKYHASPHAHVFEVDNALCPDLQLVTRKQCSPPLYHVGPASPVETSMHAPVDRMYKAHEHVRSSDVGSSMDLQQRLDDIVAINQQREHISHNHASMTIPSHPHHTYPPASISNTAASADKKVYCTHWIRHGECDYVQQGCRYKHEMPSLEKLKDIGFTKYPSWWTDKVQYARPNVTLRARGDTSAIRRMVEAQLGKSKGSAASGSETEESVGIDTPVRQRVAVAAAKTLQSSTAAESKQETKPTPKPPTFLKRESAGAKTPPPVPPRKHDTNADLLDLISDSESDTLQPALRAPVNSPEHTPATRQGRFVPYNEPQDSNASGTPERAELRSPSPLLLEPRLALPMNAKAVQDVSMVANTIKAAVKSPVTNEPPVGYQGKDKEISDRNTHVLPETKHHNGNQHKRIEQLEAEVSALRHRNANSHGLARSKYADRVSRPQITPTPTGPGQSNSAHLRPKRRHRTRGSTSPILPRKAVSAMALAGLQESREREEKAKENVPLVKAEIKPKVKQQSTVIEPKSMPVKGYRYLFEQGV